MDQDVSLEPTEEKPTRVWERLPQISFFSNPRLRWLRRTLGYLGYALLFLLFMFWGLQRHFPGQSLAKFLQQHASTQLPFPIQIQKEKSEGTFFLQTSRG